MLYKKSVLLKDNFNFETDIRNFQPRKDIEVQWQKLDNSQTYATLISHKKSILNLQAKDMPILSERARTLKNLPKMRIVNTKVERIW